MTSVRPHTCLYCPPTHISRLPDSESKRIPEVTWVEDTPDVNLISFSLQAEREREAENDRDKDRQK